MEDIIEEVLIRGLPGVELSKEEIKEIENLSFGSRRLPTLASPV